MRFSLEGLFAGVFLLKANLLKLNGVSVHHFQELQRIMACEAIVHLI